VFTLFQIFTSVVIFGLFHGLVFLPVILSICGPDPYDTNFISPLDTDPNNDKLNTDYEVYVHTDGNLEPKCTELQPLQHNGRANGNIYNHDFPPLQDGDICNNIPNGLHSGHWDQEHNQRVSAPLFI